MLMFHNAAGVTWFACQGASEEAWLAYLMEQGEREDAERELEEDLEHEHALALEWLEDPDQNEWPWYAKRCYTVQKPQVFGP